MGPTSRKMRNKMSHIKRTFGLEWDEYQALIKKQDNKCAICGEAETATVRGKVKELAVDHDHDTGKARGLLCSKCNVMIGMSQENPAILASAINYLDKYRVIL
ncbi:endonuclease VII [Cronobacter phage vB_CsaP_GAP52]|uniref:Endonuclease VII n=1 Tax=Cronobacter phage vB_CsaP_GAP52 TaxID=1141137 RepID=K4F9S6_9CAUD|nr:endonuclease VII [Cronobacter phage vB_CsaP_GAP52]AFC22025.1 endonuclease VII [Cronobacter phage vB_CsaP_GAP52]